MNTPLQRMTAELLERRGAVVDRSAPDHLEVLLPPEWQQRLGLPEWTLLGFSAEVPAAARRVGLDPEWMERLTHLLGSDGTVGHRWLPAVHPAPGHPERILEHGLVLQNAVHRLQEITPAQTSYLILLFRYTALSEEKREGLLRVGCNLTTGAVIDGFLDDLLALLPQEHGGDDPPPPEGHLPGLGDLPPLWDLEQIHARLTADLPTRIQARLQPFLEGLRRRQERDLHRLHHYYTELSRETVAREPSPSRQEPSMEAFRQTRLEAIAAEYRAKVADLRQKYAVTIQIRWVQSLLLTVPIHRFQVVIRRRKGERRLQLDWNPLVRRLEIPPCEAGLPSDNPARVVCDAALHLLSPAGHGDCPDCGKPFCRACTRQCPRCRLQVRPP